MAIDEQLGYQSIYPMRRLCNVGVFLLDCEHKTPKPAALGYPYIAIPDIKEGRLDLSNVRLISKDDFEIWTRKTKPQASDIIVTRRARVGDTAVVPSGLECAIGQNLVILRSDGTQIDKAYLRWALRGPLYKEQVYKFLNVGAIFDSLNCRDIPQFEIPVPSLPEQKAIAHILGTLDDKIELNREMNQTLEAIARAIFKSWFVDFDPVRAKMEGRLLAGMDAATAELFPDEFEESALGMIPKGWKVEEIRSLTKSIQYGLTRSASTNLSGSKFLRITDIQGGRVDWDKVPFCEVSPEESERYRVHEGDIFVARTGASTGENIYIVNPPNAMFASYLVRFQFSDFYTARIVGAFMRTASYFDYVAGAIGGSAQPNASAQVLAAALLVFPSSSFIAQRFYERIQPLDKAIAANQEQSRTLTSIRDTLLPKLLSGEIRVKEAEKVLEALK